MIGETGGREATLFYAATLERNRSTDDRNSAAWLARSLAERSIKSAERFAFSFAAAVPAMPRATFAVPVISAAAAFCRLTALAMVAVNASISLMMAAIAATFSAARLVANCTSAIWDDISSVALAV